MKKHYNQKHAEIINEYTNRIKKGDPSCYLLSTNIDGRGKLINMCNVTNLKNFLVELTQCEEKQILSSNNFEGKRLFIYCEDASPHSEFLMTDNELHYICSSNDNVSLMVTLFTSSQDDYGMKLAICRTDEGYFSSVVTLNDPTLLSIWSFELLQKCPYVKGVNLFKE